MYVGGKLADLVGDGGPARVAARRMAGRGGERLTELAREYTPVDSGAVRAASEQVPVTHRREAGADVYRSAARNRHWRAQMLEAGVRPHTIRPKGDPEGAEALTTPEGPRAEVDHPGYPGAHMLARAAAQVEHELGELLRPDAEAWAQATEAEAKRHPGIA